MGRGAVKAQEWKNKIRISNKDNQMEVLPWEAGLKVNNNNKIKIELKNKILE